MPSFGRLKHSNRSQHTLPEQLSTGAGAGTAPGSPTPASAPGALPGAAQTQQAQAQAQAQAQGQAQAPAQAHVQAQADSPPETSTPMSSMSLPMPLSVLSSPTALASSDRLDAFVDARAPLSMQQQHHHHHHDPPLPPPPAQLFNPHHPGVNPPPSLQTSFSGPGVSLAFDGQQLPTPIDFDPSSAGRSQSQRWRASVAPQQHQFYGTAAGSIDDLSGSGAHHQQPPPPPPPSQQQQQPPSSPAPTPQKRSTRKLIKGIFGSSSRDSHDAQQQQPPQPPPLPQSSGYSSSSNNNNNNNNSNNSPSGPYDNTTGLARRPSKRVSNPPSLRTSPSQTAQLPPDRDWQPKGPGSQQPSPLRGVGELDEYSFSRHGSNIDSPIIQDSRFFLRSNGIRQVSISGEHLETSPYDEVYQPPDHPPPHHQLRNQQTPPPLQQPQPQPLQRQETLRIQEQQAQYESQQQLLLHHHQQQQEQQQQQQRHAGAGYDQQSPEQGRQPQPNFQYPTSPAPEPCQPGGEPRLVTNQLVPGQQLQNAETVSQLSHDSPVADSDPRSTFQQYPGQPSQAASLHTSAPSHDIAASQTTPLQEASPQGQDQSAMAPPASAGGPSSSRRSQDAETLLRGQADPPGPPPPYQRQASANLSTLGPMPPLPGQGAPPNAGHRGDRGPQYVDASPGVEPGRSSPQPSDRDLDLDKHFRELASKYKHVKRLFFDSKNHIERLNGQIEQLQNAVANQRMSQSRTAWDDNEYLTRFNRLNGAINNLSFNIRKDWRSLPAWINNVVSADALKTGKQEMTAIGRAVVSRWLVEEVFNKCFHPALDTQLSSQLKEIELSIRKNSHTMHHQEEVDAHTTKVVNWRMATLDGLQQRLNSNAAADNRGMLTDKITTNLTAYLYQHLSTPPPPGLEGSTSMIAELTVAIAANLPLESRDVSIMYPLPGEVVQKDVMEVEKPGLPTLDGRKADADADAGSDQDGVDEKDKAGKPRGDEGKPGTSQMRTRDTAGLNRENDIIPGTMLTKILLQDRPKNAAECGLQDSSL
ncbi:uncharacterized protein MAM_01606 [Metarhizium album ARSEF 1941]|uniref:S-adenosylmethionine-dependent methyltransferase-like protein n=1 Tax=Metarhizium album (strain ARSEF 1941) TaxID=1081103 RepID=A0A0B2X520_METAS|nr:uncharacterized protein MAM_01606 [Metarhizium album ARSEF 1941]KHO00828.1 hypothetical protein MAM_01606 [Metarhizium album ARSEF 1941]